MKSRKLILALFFCVKIFAGDGNYAIAQGEEDRERLLIVNEIYNPLTRAFLADVGVAQGDKVLEIGCGFGVVSQELSHMVGENGYVLATDLNEEQLHVARSLLTNETQKNLEFRKLSACELSSLNEQFDVVYMRFLLCHLPHPEEIIRQVKSILKPGGRFIIEDITGNETLYSDPRVEAIEILQYMDKLQFELQNSDDHYFAKLSHLLVEEGFKIAASQSSHPELDTLRKRKMLTGNLESLKNALIEGEKMSLSEYESMYPLVEALVQDLSIKVFSYELGQICVTH